MEPQAYYYLLEPDDLTVGGWNITIKRTSDDSEQALSFFIAEDWDRAEAIAQKGFEQWVLSNS